MTRTIKYQSSGSDKGKTILFLHGGGVAGWMWDQVVNKLQDFHCLVPDMPEHGQSMETKPFTIELAANQTIELIREQAHGRKAVVVGLSEGAQVVVQMMATAPEMIDRAVVSSAILLPMPGYGWLYSPRFIGLLFRMSIPPFRNNDWWMRLNMKYSAGMPDDYYPQYRANFQIMTESQFVNLLIANQKFRMPENLGKVKVPTLILAGMHEYKVMKESVRQLTKALPNAQAKLIDLGKGSSMRLEHNWAMNAPDQFAQTVRAFINNQTLPKVLRQLE
jgi:pimeloyl-ACP methyl ester carboxylesterase